MKEITQSMDYEGLPFYTTPLHTDLREFHSKHPFQTGVDWQFKYLWARMTDEDCLAFCLKYPEHSNRFKDVQ